ncbi:MAG: hypothetical protein LBE92_07200 [Chryseobacterium sp.]|jgi:uncharacterized membrane protein YbjE (DUF340 family)|uniref:hypothetical protein n=1 Tax=Chryseobacterium sp. TaxID=1871047 RepID=UPI0028243225|nr:hypothetical protein [Chryseobacterium sp.]MDR2235894.1 hypothetical protein [Chryseobacterium sp.]
MKIVKPFLIRLLITAIPLIVIWFWADMAFKANRQKEHPTDVGLGMAVVLFFVLAALLFGFITDCIARLIKKDYKTALIDLPFLIFFLLPILYLNCLWSGGGDFCEWLTHITDTL